jgi:hypothetical protein
MPHGRTVPRLDKLARLIAVFDQFHNDIALLDDPRAKQLAGNWARLRDQYATPVGAPRSAFAAGMEQGLRETPMLLRSMRPESRKLAADALAAAITTHYAEFFAKDAIRLEKIKARGSIRSENEFYLVRHNIDLLEGEPSREEELRLLYRLVDRFEARGT